MSAATGATQPRPVATWWFWAAAAVLAVVGAAVGLVTHDEGVAGSGGVECGSVWFVTSYHSGCESWLDAMSRVAFVFLGASVGVLTAGFVRGRRGSLGWATVGVLMALAVAVLGPRIWADRVFETFGY